MAATTTESDQIPLLLIHKAGAPALAHPSRHGVVTPTLEEFTYAFVNTLSPEDPAAVYERYAVPETGQIFDGVLDAPLETVSERSV